jgi:heme oxygenase
MVVSETGGWVHFSEVEPLLKPDETPAPRARSATDRLHNICDALSEQADESPFTREEWDRIDAQTVAHLALLRRCYNELPNPEFIPEPEKEQRVRALLQDLARVVCKPVPVKTGCSDPDDTPPHLRAQGYRSGKSP